MHKNTPTSLSLALAAALLGLAGCGGGELSSSSLNGFSAASRDTTIATETSTASTTSAAATTSNTATSTSTAAAATVAATVATASSTTTSASTASSTASTTASAASSSTSTAADTASTSNASATTTESSRPATVSAVSSATVELQSSVTQHFNSYESIGAGPYRVVNNTWGVRSQPSGWSQQVGISSLQADNSVDFRLKWSFPYDCGGSCEVVSYPEVAYGRSASFTPDAGAKLPRLVSEVSSLVTRYAGASASTSGKAHLSYDLWTSNSPYALARGNRLAEIMLPEIPFAGYGVPNYPEAAAAGRAGQLAAGRNPAGYQGRETLGGAQYDVYFFPAGSPYTGLAWKFIVFEPVVFGGTGGATRNWKPLIDHMLAKGWINGSDYLNSVELGVEPISAAGGSFGDLTVRGYKVDVN